MVHPLNDPQSASRKLRFGVFEVDPRARELRKHGVRIPLQPRPFQALLLLLQHPNEVVTREELQKRLWSADVFVDFDHGLNTAIRKVRRALNDDAGTPRFIETVGRQGYRFLVPVEFELFVESASSAEVQASSVSAVTNGFPAPKEPRGCEVAVEQYGQAREASVSAQASVKSTARNRMLLGAALAAVLAAGATIAARVPRSRSINSLAVIPFANSTGDPDAQYLSDGITEGVIDDLSHLPQLSVMARSTVFHYAGAADPLQVGRNLHVRALLTGRLFKQQDTLILQTELVQVENGARIWGTQYSRKFSDLASLQDEIAKDISRQLRLRLSGDENARLGTRHTPNQEAYQLYLAGLYHQRKADLGNSAQESQKAVDAFTQAMIKDPQYAPPYAELAGLVLAFSQQFGPSASEAAAKARQSALKALQVDPALAAAHVILGTIKRDFDWDWPGAAGEFERAIALDPNSSAAHAGYALLLTVQSQFPMAIKEAKLAHDLDLMNLTVSANLITIYLLARQYDLAIQQCHKLLEVEPALLVGHTFCGTVYFYQGEYTKAFDEWQQMTDQSDPAEFAMLKRAADANTKFGYREGLRIVIQYLESSPGFRHPADIAALYASIGETDKAFQFLEKAYRERDAELLQLTTFPGYDSLRSDPRYKKLLHQMGLESD